MFNACCRQLYKPFFTVKHFQTSERKSYLFFSFSVNIKRFRQSVKWRRFSLVQPQTTSFNLVAVGSLTELREQIVQCNFQPWLEANTLLFSVMLLLECLFIFSSLISKEDVSKSGAIFPLNPGRMAPRASLWSAAISCHGAWNQLVLLHRW